MKPNYYEKRLLTAINCSKLKNRLVMNFAQLALGSMQEGACRRASQTILAAMRFFATRTCGAGSIGTSLWNA
jgi:hypothetical protein